jgi:peptidoglycan/xylan/chitin deacetylase (PgdA/CDA1 family)
MINQKMSMILKRVFTGAFLLALGQVAIGQASQPFQKKNITEFGLVGTHTIALTFDDGPGDGTERILNLLKKYGVKATFFDIGENVVDFPDLPKRVVAEGHLLGNHTWDHPHLDDPMMTENPDKLRAELTKTDKIVRAAAPNERHIYFRAPYGKWRETDADILNQAPSLDDYIGPIYWDVGTKIHKKWIFWGPMTASADWDCWDHHIKPRTCLKGYLKQIEKKDGGVILSHDLYSETAEMWEELLPKLVAKGYKFVTLDEVAALEKYRASADAIHKEKAANKKAAK